MAGLAASSFFPPIVMGIFNKKMNMQGAVAGMVSGFVFTVGYIVWFKMMNGGANNTPDNWLLGISSEGIGTVGMLLNFAVSLTVAKFTPPPPEDVQRIVEDIRVPKAGD